MFLIFAGQHNEGYSAGGWNDKLEDFYHEDIAIKFAEKISKDYDWVHVVDLEARKIIWER